MALVYKKLQSLLDEEDVRRLEEAVPVLAWKLAENPATASFGEFFETNYISCIKQWGRGYCDRSGIGANSHFERMHNIFKEIYLKGMKNVGLDVAICSLLNLVFHEEFYPLIGVNQEMLPQISKDINRKISCDVNDKLNFKSKSAVDITPQSGLSSMRADEVAFLFESVGNGEQILSTVDTLGALNPEIQAMSSRDGDSSARIVELPLEVKSDRAEIQLELGCYCE